MTRSLSDELSRRIYFDAWEEALGNQKSYRSELVYYVFAALVSVGLTSVHFVIHGWNTFWVGWCVVFVLWFAEKAMRAHTKLREASRSVERWRSKCDELYKAKYEDS